MRDRDCDRGRDRDRDYDRDGNHGRISMAVRSKNIVLCRQRDFIGAYGIFNNRVKYVDGYI